VWWIFSTGQLVAGCCCPCVAGKSIGCWDGLGDASSFGQGDGDGDYTAEKNFSIVIR